MTDAETELAMQAHSHLHKGDVKAAHNALHRLLGADDVKAEAALLSPTLPFDQAFRALCVAHDVRAAYVSMELLPPNRARLITGGEAEVNAFLDRALRRGGEMDG